ncbi:DUF2249 domain-containing protein [Aquincola tertiaricarbonis]|uniref:DUF2249 domain-containing protein n=1 Tax=Aquincola tertiaricarbonis TaxID=391953 RepID=A0ABY4S391_AQUTE|nr:DUF2249 domain-containing protein [Aquincola tertiaricarbonis]URI07913.1 DUF2249 domain-containing protein [Aquincola tertiaricarbonis]
MSQATASNMIDVRAIPGPERHATIFAAFKALAIGDALEISNDHDPRPLYHQFQAEVPGNFSWMYLQNGPAVWRVSVQKLGRSHGAGGCCGVCGGGA